MDANGTQVGNVVGSNTNTPSVVLTMGGLTFGVGVRSNRLLSSIGGLLFTSADCSGPPLILADFDPAEMFLRAVVFGLTVYLPDTGVSATTQTTISFLSADGSDIGQCKVDGFPRSVYPALPPIVLPFTPPFRVLFVP